MDFNSENNKSDQIIRSVLIFPHFENTEAIEHVRSMFDPAYGKVSPHITLVFPFSSIYTASEILNAVVTCSYGISPFSLTLKEVVIKSTFLFMLPEKGRENVIKLFTTMHNGFFSPFLPQVLEKEKFIPHLTLGKCTQENEIERLSVAKSLLGEYNVFIDKISVEIIAEDSKSIIESEVLLK